MRSRASIGGHPIHPMLIPLPVAFLVGAFLADLTYLVTDGPFFARAALWLTGAGAIGGLIAAPFGLVDYLSLPGVRDLRWARIHLIGNVAVLALAVVSWIVRAGDPAEAVLPWGILTSALWSAILGVTGWAGGEMSYRDRVGVVERDEPGASTSEAARRRAA